MSTQHTITTQFHQLWPTQLMELTLPGHEMANPVLADFVLQANASRDDMTAQYLNDNIFMIDHPALQWLNQCCHQAILDYARNLGIDYDLDFAIQGWPNVNMKGDYHNLHNHPHSWLSGTYYIAVPDQSSADQFRSDLNFAAISFYDPRPQANMNAIRGDGQIDPEHRVQPQGGQLLLWPSFLHHFVHPNGVDMPRLSISFNVVLKWKKEYLPY